MELINTTNYDQKALSAMNRLASATVQKKKTMTTRSFCIGLGILGLAAGIFVYLRLPEKKTIGNLCLLYGILLMAVGLNWNRFQAWTSGKMMSPGIAKCTYSFEEDAVTVTNDAGESRYAYSRFDAAAEDDDWFMLFMDSKHGMIIDKSGFTAGSDEDLRTLIQETMKLPLDRV